MTGAPPRPAEPCRLVPQVASRGTPSSCGGGVGAALFSVLTIGLAILFDGTPARAQASRPPDVVKLPTNLDTGGSSFYDGFGRTDPGFIFLNFARWNHLTSIKDASGHNSAGSP